jgi:hypothetical protein
MPRIHSVGRRYVGVSLALVLAGLLAGVACGPAKPPMTPDSETEQQLPDLPDGGGGGAPAATAPQPASK